MSVYVPRRDDLLRVTRQISTPDTYGGTALLDAGTLLVVLSFEPSSASWPPRGCRDVIACCPATGRRFRWVHTSGLSANYELVSRVEE